jgi:hypothetical protein
LVQHSVSTVLGVQSHAMSRHVVVVDCRAACLTGNHQQQTIIRCIVVD